MNRIQLTSYRDALRVGLQRLEAVTVGCASCSQFAAGRCKLVDLVPPPDVQRDGCEQWNWDGVPL